MPAYDPQRNPNKGVVVSSMKKKSKVRFIFIPIVLLLVAVVAFTLWPANISRHEAQEIAISHVGGGAANRAGRDFERFQRVWSVEVFHNNLVHEVYVSMSSGEVILVEIDRWD